LSSISTLTLPWPAVVVGDSLRDSTGNATPLGVEAFDAAGRPVSDARVTVIALDTGLTILPGRFVRGDNVRASPARVVIQVQRGGDILETPADSIAVVARPDTVSPAGFDTLSAKTYTYTSVVDTTRVTSEAIQVTVRNRALLASGAANAGVRSWVVYFQITAEPPGVEGALKALFSGATHPHAVADTTDANGVASRQVVLRTAVLTGTRTGTQQVKVLVTVRERGQNVPGSPIEVVVPFDVRPAQ
jgi:hypothetical protein